MTNKNLYEGLGGLDPELIEKAAPADLVKHRKKRGWIRYASFAACLMLIVSTLIGILMRYEWQPSDVSTTHVSETTVDSNIPNQIAFEMPHSMQYHFKYNENSLEALVCITEIEDIEGDSVKIYASVDMKYATGEPMLGQLISEEMCVSEDGDICIYVETAYDTSRVLSEFTFSHCCYADDEYMCGDTYSGIYGIDNV